ncbi:hypothetical protein NECID01_1692 [Nematocida sp. AWRm77]|nr:hypothetical protein NECID01_1692 [Nematocida sp. AWRm77]
MSPKRRLIVLGILLLLISVGVLIALFVTVTPRNIEYSLVSTGEVSCKLAKMAGKQCPNTNRKAIPLCEALQELDLIQTDEDLDDSDVDIPIYNIVRENCSESVRSIPTTMLYQTAPQNVQSFRNYMHFQNTGDVQRHLYFIDTPNASTEYIIAAQNNNLQARQKTGIFVFFIEDGKISGVVLNMVWMHPRTTTFISVVTSCRGDLYAVADFDGNVNTFYGCES